MRRTCLLFLAISLVLILLASSPALASGKTILVFGKVVDNNGRPLENATVDIVDGWYRPVGTTYTDRYGDYELIVTNERNTLRAEISKDDGGQMFRCVSIWYPATNVTQINVKLESYEGQPSSGNTILKDTITVSGKVLDANDLPVENAIVTLQNGNYEEISRTVTGSDGRFLFVGVQPGSNSIRARTVKVEMGGKYNNTTSWYPAQNFTVIDVRLWNYPDPAANDTDSGWIWGTVQCDGAPFTDAWVVLDGQVKQKVIYDPFYSVRGQKEPAIVRDASCPQGFYLKPYNGSHYQFKFKVPSGIHQVMAYSYRDGKIWMSNITRVEVVAGRASISSEMTVLEVAEAEQAQVPMIPDSVTDYHWELPGKVVDRNGRGMPCVSIFLNDSEYGTVERLMTNDSGHFLYSGKHSGLRNLSIMSQYADNGTEPSMTYDYSLLTSSSGIRTALFVMHDYPVINNVTDGYIWGIIATDDGAEYGTAISGTVYLSNGMSASVSDGEQYFFNVPAGTYDIYATHTEGYKNYTSKVRHVEVRPTNHMESTECVKLIVEPEPRRVSVLPLLAAAGMGLTGIFAMLLLLRRKL